MKPALRIEIAALPESPMKDKGDLLEELAAEFLLTQGFNVVQQVRLVGTELDLLCEHKVSKRQIYVECKAFNSTTLSANHLKNLLGTVTYNDYEEGWIVSTGPLGKDAKGFVHDWGKKSKKVSTKLSFYTPERIIDALVDSKVIKSPPTEKAIEILGNEDLLGDWLLLVNPFGTHWIMSCLSSGLPIGVLIFSAKTGLLLEDQNHLRNISKTDSSISKLDFDYLFKLRRTSSEGSNLVEREPVVEVIYGDTWNDYRPARPEHFVGRKQSQNDILRLLETVKKKETDTRVFAITGDSGMGKSSLIAKVRDQSRNKQQKNKVFIFAVDMRAAKSPTYILSSLQTCLNKANASGFGGGNHTEFKITNVSKPLESESIQNFLADLEKAGQVVCLILDQFEELYSKTALLPVFEAALQLFLSAIASRSNLVLGFAWKSDASTQLDHPAYFMWHRLSDHRHEINLKPFNQLESNNAITVFEKATNQKLRHELRRQIIDQSSSYPWLLKKFCIHLYENSESGIAQVELSDNAKSLFDKDLQKLSQPETLCLRFVAQNAPAELFEVYDIYGHEIVKALQDKRLIIQSGDRLNIYWDIFREYLLTNEVPSISLDYIPSSSSLRTILMAVRYLSHEEPKSYAELGELNGITEKTARNFIRDLAIFGVVQIRQSQVKLDPSVSSSDPTVVLQKLRTTLRRHAVKLEIYKLEDNSIIQNAQIIEVLKSIKSAAHYNSATWAVYAERMALWLHMTGYLTPTDNGDWVVHDQGGVLTASVPKRHGRHSSRLFKVFIGDTSPAQTIEALEKLIDEGPISLDKFLQLSNRNAVSILRRFELAEVKNGEIFPLPLNGLDSIEAIWQAAKQQETLSIVIDYLKEHHNASGLQVGQLLNEHYKKTWTQTSESRIGNAVRQWAVWIMRGDSMSTIPTPPGTRTDQNIDTGQVSIFDVF